MLRTKFVRSDIIKATRTRIPLVRSVVIPLLCAHPSQALIKRHYAPGPAGPGGQGFPNFGGGMNVGRGEEEVNPLEKYGTDLTKLANEGKLDPVIGRDEEIRRTIQILSRRTKNNPALIGQAGTGKTAIIEGLARENN